MISAPDTPSMRHIAGLAAMILRSSPMIPMPTAECSNIARNVASDECGPGGVVARRGSDMVA